jgi:hypothetical protein
MKTGIKFIAGVTAVVLAFSGVDSISDALFVPYTTLLTGFLGLGYLLGALAIAVWFIVDGSSDEY